MDLPFAAVVLAVATFLVMEPLTYVTHRWVMHGFGMAWHRSHHARRHGPFERNDWYPVVFASVTVVAMSIGALVPALSFLLPIGVGVTAYGLAYLFVHDGYIHRRLPGLTGTLPALERLADAHALHHRFGAEPYGMLAPVVPEELQRRAEAAGFVREQGVPLRPERLGEPSSRV